MFKTLKNAWKIPELKNKLLFTLLIVILYRLGSAIPVPYVDPNFVNAFTQNMSGSMFDYLNTLSGGMFYNATLFALSVSPYITASIVVQLLTIAIPALERLSKEGEEGKAKINKITRYITVALSLVTAFGYTMLLKSNGAFTFTDGEAWDVFKYIVVIASYCAGASIVMWIAEKIDEYGIGNGISIILFANIVSSIPSVVTSLWKLVFTKGTFRGFSIWGLVLALACIAIILAVIALIVCVTNSERRIPIQYAKRVVGRKMYGGQGTNLPIKVNMTGVMPIIFASSIASLPATLAAFFPKIGWLNWIATHFGYNSWIYVLINVILVVAFSYFYVMISFNPVEVANNIKDNGGAVPGIRPGKPTADYIKKILNRITAVGAIFLCFVSCFPMAVTIIAGYFNWEITSIAQLAFGGTSLIIVIGVALETVRELEAQMTMRNYKGFLD